MAKRKGKAKPVKMKFNARQRRLMVEDLEKADYQDLVDSTIQQLQSGVHLEQYESRRQSVRVICDGAAKESLVSCILELVLAFLEMYWSHKKGQTFRQHGAGMDEAYR